jgi:Ca2+-binding EF-hand superfamily protein
VKKITALIILFSACGFARTDDRAKPQAAEDYQDLVLLAEGRPLFVRAHVRVDGKPFRAAWENYVDRVFKFLDLNGDGVLDKNEVDRMPPTQLLIGGAPNIYTAIGPSGTQPNRPVANADGKVTRDDFAAFLRRAGAAAFQFQNGGGGLNPYGVRVINIGQQEPVSSEAMNDAIFELLDTNHDGKLSKEELAAAPARFLIRDVNDDEMVTAQELVGPKRAAASQPGYQVVRETPSNDVEVTLRNNNPVVLLNPGESGSALAKRLIERYGKGRKKLTNDDLGLDPGVFARLDADKDGTLDAEELAQFAKRAPDVELTFRVGTKGEKEAALEGKAQAGGVREAKLTPSDGGMTLETGVSRFEMFAGEATANSKMVTNFKFRLRDQYINFFKMADTDGNGYLDAKEAEASPAFRGLFKAFDTDGDGMLYEKEMVAYLDKLEDVQKAVREGCVTLTMNDKGSGLFDLLDTDHDGRLSVREMRGAPELLKLSRSGDGCLTRADVPRHFEMRVRRGPAAGSDFGNVFVVSARINGFDNGPTDKGVGPLWFRKMDTNHDGDLSRREFLGSDEDFKKLDADGDGLISAKEAEAAEKLWKKSPPKK